uniref:Malic enzyme NAD-binding domain-containing protein n=1 Tax=Aegilops tauschii subsp. strangulata TaxID=200361 RepID=A0A453E6H6_AEGTS
MVSAFWGLEIWVVREWEFLLANFLCTLPLEEFARQLACLLQLMLVLTMSNCLTTSSTSGFGKDVLLERSIMSSWKSSWMLLNKYMVKKFSSSLKTLPITMRLICLRNIARAILFSMMISRGTASVVLAGLLSSLKVVGGTLAEHTYLFLGAGEAGTGIAELIALEISKQTNAPIEECRKKVFLVDSKGLIVSSRKNSLQPFKTSWAHEREPVTTLLDAIKSIRPTVLIGTSGVGRAFTKEVIEAMASFNERPVIFSLSNPTSHSECTAEEAYKWTQGRAVFASGSPFDPVEYDGKIRVPGQANNAYIFPGFGLGVVISGAIRVHEDMLLAASETLAAQATQENFDKGSIFPPFTNIRKISALIAASVAAKAYELGLATRLPRPRDLEKYAESCMYTPVYRSYR